MGKDKNNQNRSKSKKTASEDLFAAYDPLEELAGGKSHPLIEVTF